MLNGAKSKIIIKTIIIIIIIIIMIKISANKKQLLTENFWIKNAQSGIVINFDNSEQNKPLANRRSNFCASDAICEASAIIQYGGRTRDDFGEAEK